MTGNLFRRQPHPVGQPTSRQIRDGHFCRFFLNIAIALFCTCKNNKKKAVVGDVIRIRYRPKAAGRQASYTPETEPRSI